MTGNGPFDAPSAGPDTNTGHGHVWRRSDGQVARCGGTTLCRQCKADAGRWIRTETWTDTAAPSAQELPHAPRRRYAVCSGVGGPEVRIWCAANGVPLSDVLTVTRYSDQAFRGRRITEDPAVADREGQLLLIRLPSWLEDSTDRRIQHIEQEIRYHLAESREALNRRPR